MKKKKLLLIGPYPKPYGGVSIHLVRLAELLKDDFEISKVDESPVKKPEIFNLRSYRFLSYCRLINQSDVMHVHSGHYIFRLLHFLTSKIFNKKMVMTLHSYELLDKSSIEKYVDKVILNNSFRVICVSPRIAENVKLVDCFVKEAFLPPIVSGEIPLPAVVSQWIGNIKDKGYLICSGNASRLDVSNNEDLYGLDLFIEAARRCKEKQLKLAFVFVVSDTSGELDIDMYKNEIAGNGLNKVFFMHESSLSFINIILQSDIILRPTNTDGDALTVREGIFLNKKVIASDVSVRPPSVNLFKNRNAHSLTETLEKVFYELQDSRSAAPLETETQKNSEYLDFYKKVLQA